MPPPSLLSSTIVRSSPSRLAASRPPMSCRSAMSPIRSTTGPSHASAAPNADDTVPSIPLAPRFESTRGPSARAGRKVSTSRIGIDEATNNVASDPSHSPRRAATQRLRQLALRGCPRQRRPRRDRRRAKSPASHPATSRPSGCGSGLRSRMPTTASGSCQRLWGSKAIWGTSASDCQPGAQRLGGGQIAEAKDEIGAVLVREDLVAQQQVVMGDGRLAPTRARQRIGEQWNPRPGRIRSQLRRVRCARAGDHEQSPGRVRARARGGGRSPGGSRTT